MQRIILIALPPQQRNVANYNLKRSNRRGDQDQNRQKREEEVNSIAQMTIQESFGCSLAASSSLSFLGFRHRYRKTSKIHLNE